MAKYRKGSVSGIILEIGGDSTGLAAAIEAAYQSAGKLESELRDIDRVLRSDPKNPALNRQRYDVMGQAVKETEQKLIELRRAQEQAAEAFKRGDLTAEEYRKIERQVEATEGRLKNLRREMELQESVMRRMGESLEKVGDKFKSAGQKMSDVGGKLSRTVTAPVVALGTLATKAAIEFESAMTGVQKTTDMTGKELKDMGDEIRKMSTEIPTSAVEIAGVAEAAGQLGIQRENIMGFTRTIIDLGNATNLTGEEGATALARFANITQMSQKDFGRLGSVIVELGNNSATTEAEIVAMGTRLAAAGKQAGLSESDIMALAAALSSTGIEAQAGGSALSKFMGEMQLAVETGSSDLAKFASVAGMSSDEFQKAFQDNAAGALNLFIQGLNNTERSGMSAIQMLDDMGIKEVNMRRAILGLAGAGDILTDSLDMGARAWEENTALTEEAALRYAESASQINIARNRLTDLGISIGEEIAPYIVDLTGWLADLVSKFQELHPAQQETILKLIGIAAAAGPVLKVAGGITSGIGSIITGTGKLLGKMGALGGVLSGPAGILALVGLLAGAFVAVKTWIDNSTSALRYYDDAMAESKTNFDTQTKSINATAAESQSLVARLKELEAIENKTTHQKQEMAAVVEKLNALLPDLGLEYDSNTDKLNKSAEAVEDYIDAWRKMAIAEAYQKRLVEMYEAQIQLALDRAEAQDKLTAAQEEYNKHAETYLRYQSDLAAGRVDDNYFNENTGIYAAIKAFGDLGVAERNLAKFDSKLEESRSEIDQFARTMETQMNNASTASTLGTNEVVDNLEREADARRLESQLRMEAYQQNENTERNYARTLSRVRQEELERRWQQKAELERQQREIRDATKNHHSKMFDIENEGVRQSEITLNKAITNLETQTEQLSAWQNNLRLVAKRVTPETLEYLAGLGPGFAGIVAELVNATPKQVQAFEKALANSMRLAKAEALREINGVVPGVGTVMNNLNNGIISAWPKSEASMKNGARRAKQAAIDELGGMYGVGANSVNSWASGAKSRVWALASEYQKAAMSAVRAARNNLQIASPSKVFLGIGENTIASMILGAEGMERDLARSYEGLGNTVQKSFSVLTDPMSGLDWSMRGAEFRMPDSVLQQKQVYVTGNEFIVREEADIDRIVTELDRRVKRAERSLEQ